MTRTSLALLCLGAAATTAAAQAPHVAPTNAPSRITIAGSAEPGVRIIVTGRVLGEDGRPVVGASIYAYHTDSTGRYIPGGTGAAGSDRPRLFGYLRSDAEGRWSFATIKPGSYPGTRNPSHIHFEVTAAGFQERGYEIVFADDPFLSPQFRAQAQDPFGTVAIVTARPAAGGTLAVSHDIRLRKSP